MISRLYNFWNIIKSSLWFIPAALCILYFTLTYSIYRFEIAYFPQIHLPDIFFSGGADDTKTVTIALLSSMITMATLAISITVVALSLSASQLGPRLIKTFMADRKTQIFIGLFFGVIIACFMLTIILYDARPKAITPQITISIVFTMCFANLFVLLAFVDHVAKAIIADNVILKVSSDLINAVKRLSHSKNAPSEQTNQKILKLWPANFKESQKHLYFKRSGYVQNIDYNKIIKLFEKNNMHGELSFKAGHFLVSGEDGFRYNLNGEISEELHESLMDCFIIGDTRTSTQDIEYSIRHLIEIALRALSSGINDSFTAITVLDRLSESIAILFQYDITTKWFEDSEGNIRLKAKQNDEHEIIFSAFGQIRHNARTNPFVTQHILDKLSILSYLASSRPQKHRLQEILNDINMNLPYFEDKTHQYAVMKKQLAHIRKNLS